VSCIVAPGGTSRPKFLGSRSRRHAQKSALDSSLPLNLHYLASTSASTVPPRTLAIEKAIGRWLDPDEIVVIETLGNGTV
jgi:hypothetical protein